MAKVTDFKKERIYKQLKAGELKISEIAENNDCTIAEVHELVVYFENSYIDSLRVKNIFYYGMSNIAKDLADYLLESCPYNTILLEIKNLKFLPQNRKKYFKNEAGLLKEHNPHDFLLEFLRRLFEEKRFDILKKIVNKYLEKYPEVDEAADYLLFITKQEGKLEKKIEQFANKYPSNLSVCLEYISRIQTNNIDEAISVAQKFLDLNPTSKKMVEKLIELFIIKKEFDEQNSRIIIERIYKNINYNNRRDFIQQLVIIIKYFPNNSVLKFFLLEIYYRYGICENEIANLKLIISDLNIEDQYFLQNRIIIPFENKKAPNT